MKESWNIWHPFRKEHQLALYDLNKERFIFSSGTTIHLNNANFCSPAERKDFEKWLKQQQKK